ncbi:MAG TPA: long-chain fatty acid--CoA ligase [Pyrinomonadaceae bacterium]|nr:long-chain fatty acid--CoA ligase [Pyrinomonadaceae bacterium]
MTAEQIVGFDSLPQTVPHFCLAAFQKFNKPDALSHKVKTAWQNISGEKIIEQIKNVALGLYEMGVRAGDRVAIISENRPEWSITDIAILSLRAVNVPIYTTQAAEQVRYILEDSGAKILFVSGKKIFEHAEPGIEGVESIEKLIFFDTEAIPENYNNAISLATLETSGAELNQKDRGMFEQLLQDVRADDLATVIYTSGTTGEPKGVMLTHENFTSNVRAVTTSLPILPTDRSLSVLPLSHIFERACFYVLCCNGVSIHYSANFEHLAEHLQEVRPTIMTAVPRLFEKLYHKIVRKGMTAGGFKTKLFVWALDVGQNYAETRDKEKSVSPVLAAKQAVASRLVFSKWRAGVGGSLRFFVSGGAPLSKKLSYAFWGAGIPIIQGYGMTEACIVSANFPDDNKVGSIGKPLPGIEIKIAEEDGEILVRGKNVMRGYYNKPTETAEVLTTDGWYKTGDVGYKGDDGHFYLTDRKKDLFKLSNGKYIAPQQLESLIKQSGLVSQATVVGSGRKQVAALIVPDFEALKTALAEKGIDASRSRDDLIKDDKVVKFVQREISELTSELNDYERVKKIALLPREVSIDKGEMTPTLKIKRGVIDENYRELIDGLLGGAD